MTQRREVIISGWLQNVRKKTTGTLLRKKKFVCEEALWVALCVHNDRAPHLEWYPNEDCMFDHRPKQLVDLLDVAFVSSIMTDSRMFIIEFKDSTRPSIELCALSADECTAWVESARSTLSRLSCLQEDNHYQPCPTEMNFPNVADEIIDENVIPNDNPSDLALELIRLNEDIPSVSPPPLQTNESNGKAAYEHIARGIPLLTQPRPMPCRNGPFSPPRVICRQSNSIDKPPLPPRMSDEAKEEPCGVTSVPHSQYDVLKPSAMVPAASGIYDSFTTPEPANDEITLPVRKRSSSSSSDSSIDCQLLLAQSTSNGKYLRPPKHRVTFSDDDNDTSTTDSQSDIYNRPRSCQSDDSATVALEQAMTKPRIVCLKLSVCVEHLALVEIEGRVWVAGWSPEYNKHLNQLLRVGDEIIEVGDQQVNGIEQMPTLFHTQTIPGNPVSLKIRPIPAGYVCSFVKPLSGSKTLGIILHKKKNRIDEVTKNSVAGKAHLPAVLEAFSAQKAFVSSVITDVDDTPMNPFANNEQLIRRLEAIRHGSVFTITVHPHDFVKLLKTQLKQIKGYKRFLIDN